MKRALRWLLDLLRRRRRMPDWAFDFPFPKEMRYTRCYTTKDATFEIKGVSLGQPGQSLDE